MSNNQYWRLVRDNANFRNLWFGQIVSLLGDWFNLIASATLIAVLTGSGTAVGGLFVVRMLAPFLVAPFAGVLADRMNRKHLLIATDLVRGVVVLGFFLVREPGDVWLLYALTAVQLGISGFFFPTRNALLPDLVEREDLGAANALSSATWSVMLALGTALGGFVAGGFGVTIAFAVDAITFFLSAFFILRIVYTPDVNLSSKDRKTRGFENPLGQYIEGLRYLRAHHDVLIYAVQKAIVALLVWGSFQVLQVNIAEQVFVIGEGGGIGLGFIFAVSGIGTGLGPIFVRWLTGDRDGPLRRAMILNYLVAAVGIAMIAPLGGFGWVLLGTFLRGFGSGVAWVFSTQLLLQSVPDKMRGRVFATEFALFTLAGAAGASLVGFGADSLGWSPLIWLLAVLTWLPGLLCLPWAMRPVAHSLTGDL